MATPKRMWLVGALLGVTVLVGADAGWAACCKCEPCAEPGVACFTTPGTIEECQMRCPFSGSGNCGFGGFSVEATCGLGEFADCTFIDGQQVAAPAPAMGSPAIAMATVGLLVAGVALLARRTRRH